MDLARALGWARPASCQQRWVVRAHLLGVHAQLNRVRESVADGEASYGPAGADLRSGGSSLRSIVGDGDFRKKNEQQSSRDGCERRKRAVGARTGHSPKRSGGSTLGALCGGACGAVHTRDAKLSWRKASRKNEAGGGPQIRAPRPVSTRQALRDAGRAGAGAGKRRIKRRRVDPRNCLLPWALQGRPPLAAVCSDCFAHPRIRGPCLCLTSHLRALAHIFQPRNIPRAVFPVLSRPPPRF